MGQFLTVLSTIPVFVALTHLALYVRLGALSFASLLLIISLIISYFVETSLLGIFMFLLFLQMFIYVGLKKSISLRILRALRQEEQNYDFLYMKIGTVELEKRIQELIRNNTLNFQAGQIFVSSRGARIVKVYSVLQAFFGFTEVG